MNIHTLTLKELKARIAFIDTSNQ